MTRIVCIQCDGRQVEWRSGVLVDCSRCLGRGWQSMPAALLDGPRIARAIVAIVVIWALFVAATATLA